MTATGKFALYAHKFLFRGWIPAARERRSAVESTLADRGADSPVKWAVLFLAVLMIFPASAWLRRNPHRYKLIWGVFGFLPFGLAAIPQLDIALINWSTWPGYAKGVLFSAVDVAALAILFALPKAERPVPFRTPMLLYFAVVTLSALYAANTIPVLFYSAQLVRDFLIYYVVARAAADRKIIPPLLAGLTISLCMQAVLVLYQRYGLGMLQAHGSFEHQNLLGLVSNLVMLPLFALLLSGRRSWISVAGPIAGCIIAVMTTSRATVGLALMGMGLLYVLSMMRQLTQQKAAIGLLAIFAVAVLTPVAINSFEERFKGGPIEDGTYNERTAFIDTARGILDDHPFGVGANNFVIVANVGGYFDRAGVTSAVGSRSAHVHNIYWLTLAEIGYLGLAALLFLLFSPLKAAFVCGWRHRADRRGDLLLGLGVSLLVLYVHCYYEWIFFLADVQYIFAINLGLVAGLTQQLGYWRKAEDEPATVAADPAYAPGAARVMDEDEREQQRRDDEFWGIEPSDDGSGIAGKGSARSEPL